MINRIVEILIFLEFFLVALIIVFTYLLRLYYFIRSRNKKKLSREVTAYFAKLIPAAIPFNIENFPEEWKKIDIITPILIQYRKLVDDQSWYTTKLQVVRTLMLPLARNAAVSRDWVLRFYAAETFDVIYEKEDEKYIIKLMKDEAPLVRVNAFSAAISLGTKECIRFIIDEMATENFLTQTLYLQAFDQAPITTRPFVIDYLQETTDNAIRASCYNILIKYPPFPINWDIMQDINSSDLKLMLSAVRCVALIDKEKAVPILLDLLQDKRWQVRAMSIHFLSYLQVKQAIPAITSSLKDENEWVIILAGHALKNLGMEGMEAARSSLIREDYATFDITQHILSTL